MGSSPSSSTRMSMVDASRYLAINPTSAHHARARRTAQACADFLLLLLREPASDRLILSLPHPVSIRPPYRAIYGRPAVFSATGVAGRLGSSRVRQGARSEAWCTPTTYAKQPPCSPPFGYAFERLLPTTSVRANGTWRLTVVLRTVDRSAIGLAHVASGRYAAVASRGAVRPTIRASTADASQSSNERLFGSRWCSPDPGSLFAMSGRSAFFTIDVPGGDSHVIVRISVDGKRLDAARLDAVGSARVRVKLPPRADRVAVTASAPGAAPSGTTTPLSATR